MSDPDGFYLFEQEINMADTQGVVRVHISAEGARSLARKFPEADLVPGAELRQRTLDLAEAQAEAEELREKLAEAEAFKQNLAGLRAEGFQLTKKKGPQVKAEEVAA
jgi:hypothetical protein